MPRQNIGGSVSDRRVLLQRALIDLWICSLLSYGTSDSSLWLLINDRTQDNCPTSGKFLSFEHFSMQKDSFFCRADSIPGQGLTFHQTERPPRSVFLLLVLLLLLLLLKKPLGLVKESNDSVSQTHYTLSHPQNRLKLGQLFFS